MSDSETGKRVGMAIRYLPAAYSFEYENLLQSQSGLTKSAYASTVNDTGETRAIRLYDVGGTDHVVLNDVGGLARKYGEEALTRNLGIEVLRAIFTNNQTSYQLHGITEFTEEVENELGPNSVGVALTPYLAGYWHILETTDLLEIGQSDFVGNVQTDLGVLQLASM